MMMRFRRSAIRRAVLLLALVAAGCSGSTPSQPDRSSPTTPPPAPSGPTLSGTVTATNGGQPIGGTTVTSGAISNVTDPGGRYSLSFPAGAAVSPFSISGSGMITHNGFFSNGGSRTVDLDVFTLSNFDQAYFRAFTRNGFEAPGTLQPIRRWTRAPLIYIRTIDDTGRAILPEVLQQVATIATNVIPEYSHGRFGVAGIEFGTDTRLNQAGWITVDWTRDASQFCGISSVGREGGEVTLTYDQPGCSCGSQKIRPRTVKHEFGHSMGIWHTGQSVDLMSGIRANECDRNMTARELQYLEYLYRRPVGNTDPDNDPSSAGLLTHVRAGS
jgi:hypothetical protein